MKLKYRLSDPELAQLQETMLLEPLPQAKVSDPSALVALVGRGLVRLEHGFYWPCWDAISRDPA